MTYKIEYDESIKDPKAYFALQARELLTWNKPFTKIYNDKLTEAKWFEDGYLNACFNAIDRHASKNPDKIAIIFDSNDGETDKYTYLQCQKEIIKIANYINYRKESCDIKTVAIYMPMCPLAIFVTLACARLGITHNVIFGGFNAESLAMRVIDSDAKIIFTVGKARREKRLVDFYGNVAIACEILKKEKHHLECVVVCDGDVVIKCESDIVMWSDVLKGEIYEDSQDNILNIQNIPKDDVVIENKEGNNNKTNINSLLTKEEDKLLVEKTDVIKENDFLSIRKDLTIKKRKFLDLNRFIPCTAVNSEHPLFYLYTSGSTGKPKGIVHSTGGYLLYAALTTKKAFDVKKDDIFCCTADLGWITGHSYSVYGPLLLGCTTVIFGGVPTFPTPYRAFEIIEKYKVTHFYTAPTVIRMLQKILGNVEQGETTSIIEDSVTEKTDKISVNNENTKKSKLNSDEINIELKTNVNQPMAFEDFFKYEPSEFYKSNLGFKSYNYDLSSLRILGSVGEPINKEAYNWFRETFGPHLPLIDTYWQTEAGGVMVSPLPYQTYPIPECACFPFFGMQPVIVKINDDTVVECPENELGSLAFKSGWPGMARSILNNHDRYLDGYFKKFEGYYYTGDEAYKSKGYFFIRGRADDVLNVAGHRLSTAEIESACTSDEHIVEAAVVGIKDQVTGQSIVIFVVKRKGKEEVIRESLKQTLRDRIGPIVSFKKLFLVDEVPKTRTGKIMRRVLRDLLEGREVGDLSTCNNIECIEKIKEMI